MFWPGRQVSRALLVFVLLSTRRKNTTTEGCAATRFPSGASRPRGSPSLVVGWQSACEQGTMQNASDYSRIFQPLQQRSLRKHLLS